MSGFLKSEYCTIFQTVVISTFPALRNCNKSQTLSLIAWMISSSWQMWSSEWEKKVSVLVDVIYGSPSQRIPAPKTHHCYFRWHRDEEVTTSECVKKSKVATLDFVLGHSFATFSLQNHLSYFKCSNMWQDLMLATDPGSDIWIWQLK